MTSTDLPLLSSTAKPHRTALQRRKALLAWLLIAPALLFLVTTFVLPIGLFLYQSVDNSLIRETLVRTVRELEHWDGTGDPHPEIYSAFMADMIDAKNAQKVGALARRLSHHDSDFYGLILATARGLPTEAPADSGSVLLTIDPRWSDPAYWQILRQEAGPLTRFYLLTALGLRQDLQDRITLQVPELQLFPEVYLRTFEICTIVTILCVLLSYPVAYTLYLLPVETANRLLVFILIPFWTSLLIRTSSWVILLQSHGIVNEFLQWVGFTDRPIPLIFNRFGVYITMTQVLLPYALLPIYTAMRSIPIAQLQAALSLGARPARSFFLVFLPQTMPGLSAGALLVFILSLGYYITPAMVGGPNDQMISYFIAFFTNESINWGQASALGAILLLFTLTIYTIFATMGGRGLRRAV